MPGRGVFIPPPRVSDSPGLHVDTLFAGQFTGASVHRDIGNSERLGHGTILLGQLHDREIERSIKPRGSSTFSVVHCGGDVEFTDGEVEHGD